MYILFSLFPTAIEMIISITVVFQYSLQIDSHKEIHLQTLLNNFFHIFFFLFQQWLQTASLNEIRPLSQLIYFISKVVAKTPSYKWLDSLSVVKMGGISLLCTVCLDMAFVYIKSKLTFGFCSI